jgi:hypothetical protein
MKGYVEKDKLSKFLTELRFRAASKYKKHLETIREVHFWLANSILTLTMKHYFPIIYMKTDESLDMSLLIKQGNEFIFQKVNAN